MSRPTEYSCSYASTSRSTCKKCNQGIDMGSLRLTISVPSSRHDGMMDLHHHPKCFFKSSKADLRSIWNLKGSDDLRPEDYKMLLEVRSDWKPQLSSDPLEKKNAGKYESQRKKVWELADHITAAVNAGRIEMKHLKCILAVNGQAVLNLPLPKLTFMAARVMLYGVVRCPSCGSGAQLEWGSSMFICHEELMWGECGWTGSEKEVTPTPIILNKPPSAEEYLAPFALAKDSKVGTAIWSYEEVCRGWGEPGAEWMRKLEGEISTSLLSNLNSLGVTFASDGGAALLLERLNMGERARSAIVTPAELRLRYFRVALSPSFGEGSPTASDLQQFVVDHGGKIVEFSDSRATHIAQPLAATSGLEEAEAMAGNNGVPLMLPSYFYGVVESEEVVSPLPFVLFGHPPTQSKVGHPLKKPAGAGGPKKAGSGSGGGGGAIKAALGTRGEVEDPAASPGSEVASSDGWLLDCRSSFTDIAANLNKYYIFQVNQNDSGSTFSLYQRWGRLGGVKRDKITHFGSHGEAKKEFCTLFARRFAKQSWADFVSGKFEKRPSIYQPSAPLPAGGAAGGAGGASADLLNANDTPSRIADHDLRCLATAMFDVDVFKHTLESVGVETSSFSATELDSSVLTEAYGVLCQLEKCLKMPSPHMPKIGQLSSHFFTLIPHNFGGRAPPLISTWSLLAQKMRQVEALVAVESSVSAGIAEGVTDSELQDLANSTFLHDNTQEPIYSNSATPSRPWALAEGAAPFPVPGGHRNPASPGNRPMPGFRDPGTCSGGSAAVSALDRRVLGLNAVLSPLADSATRATLLRYLMTTHSPFSSSSKYSVTVRNIFEVDRHGEEARYREAARLTTNRALLFHGTRTCNVAGILSQGLRVAPEAAPKSGYRFGKGVYFANALDKVLPFCGASPEYPWGVVLICEVALGGGFVMREPEYMEGTPSGFQHLHALGMHQPNKSLTGNIQSTFPTGVQVPFGPHPRNRDPKDASVEFSEFVMFDESRIRIKYLALLDFSLKETSHL